jgi:hypothetical protein
MKAVFHLCPPEPSKRNQSQRPGQGLGWRAVALAWWLAVGLGTGAHAQPLGPELRGQVRDADTQEPLPFVNLSLWGATGQRLPGGGTTDIDGRFAFRLPAGQGLRLRCSYVGYAPLQLDLVGAAELVIALKKATQELKEVVFAAGENPAHRIVRRAVANRRRHDPDQLASYRYQAYNKLVITSDRSALVQDMNQKGTLIDSLTADLQGAQAQRRRAKLAKDSGKVQVDSTDYEADVFFAKQHFFLSETVTERRFMRPNRQKETVVASRTSGFKSVAFNLVAANLQPFSFYKEYLTIFENDYLNPLADNPFGRYQFFLEDSLLAPPDTTYIVSFRPQPKATFRALKGIMSISTQGYAVSSVIAETADTTALISLRFEQQYGQVDGHWFPQQLNSLLRFRKLSVGKHRVVGYGRAYLRQVQVNAGVSPRDFDPISVEALDQATSRDSLYWASHRPGPLSAPEQRTYQFMDSVGQKRGFDKFANFFRYFSTDRIPLGAFNLRFSQLIDFNNYEGYRLALPLETGDRLSRHLVLGGHLAYGFRDRALKYGGFVRVDLNRRRGFFVQASWLQDLSEPALPGLAGPRTGRRSALGLRRVFGSLMDSVRELRAEVGFRPTWNHLQLLVGLGTQQRSPTYAYQFGPLGEPPTPTFQLTEAAAELTYTANERNTLVAGRSVFVRAGYPLARLRVAQGFAGWLGGQFDYQKVDISLEHVLRSKWLGRTTVQVQAGYVRGQVPLSLLYFVPGGSATGYNFILAQAFQTAGIYEFAASQYAALFVQHNFGRLTRRFRYSRPELILAQHVGYGQLAHPELHRGLALQSLERGLLESGLVLRNLLRVEYSQTLYLGFGAGVFGRYGAYRRDLWYDNLTLRLAINLDF